MRIGCRSYAYLDERILEHVARNPGISRRELAAAFRVGHMTVCWVLLYSYHLLVQGLTPGGYLRRNNFCR
jgi:hypothetical protein